jgi:photosystem II stability/assembly factor-like uncharacterized protein
VRSIIRGFFWCAAVGATAATAVAGGAWAPPACDSVAGTAAVAFTRDEGRTLSQTEGELHGVAYTFGLVALDTPNTLVAEHDGAILRSTDAGCTWAELGRVDDWPLTLTAAEGGRAYAWRDNGATLYRIDAGGVTRLTSPVDNIIGLQADKANGAHVRLGDGLGGVWESLDAGDGRWAQIGAPQVTEPLVYRVTFDPNDLDHVLVGMATEGAFVSDDGGATWTAASGFARDDRGANVFNFAVSPADGRVVWAMGIDLGESLDGAPSGGRHIYRSRDGGRTFKRVLKQSRKVTLVNGPVMAAHPTKPHVLYFVFGTYFQSYGTDIYRYDARRKKVTTTHNPYHDVSSIAFNPADPSVMYLGLTVEEIQ